MRTSRRLLNWGFGKMCDVVAVVLWVLFWVRCCFVVLVINALYHKRGASDMERLREHTCMACLVAGLGRWEGGREGGCVMSL